jgi:murein DD-endopeptidase MepM/ murein hydrolase activator NlpD
MITLLRLARLCLLTLAAPLLAHAGLPISSSVPGGVAIVPLANVSSSTNPPLAWLGEQPIFITSNNNEWYAVVGLSLDMASGIHELRVETEGETKTYSFIVKSKNYPKQYITLKDKSKVELSADDLTRAVHEIATIRDLKHHWSDSSDTDSAFILPAEGKLASRFGLRRFFNGAPRSPHAGLDIAAPQDSPVTACAHGTVLAVDDYFFNGKTVFIDHGNGLITMYCHLNRIDVQVGEAVSQGQLLGLSGKSGRATGPHLHWSVILNGAMVNPELFVPAE